MVEFKVFEGEGQRSNGPPPDLSLVQRNPDDDLPASSVAPEEEVFKTPQDFDRSQLWYGLLSDFLEAFPDALSQDVGEMISQAAVEVHQEGRPLTLHSVSERFWEAWTTAIEEERRSRMRRVVGAQVIPETTPAVQLPKRWRVFTNESPDQRSPGAVPFVPRFTVHSDPERIMEARLSQPGLLTLHLRGIAVKFGLPPSEVDGEVETFLKAIWGNLVSGEPLEFMEIVSLFEVYLNYEWELVAKPMVGSEAPILSQEEMKSRELREALIEEMVSMGVSYPAAQRLTDQRMEAYVGEEISREELSKKVQNKARRWLRQQARIEKALKARLEQERQQGVLTRSEIAIQSLITWLVESHGMNQSDAFGLVHEVLTNWATKQEGRVRNLENMISALEESLTLA